MARVALWFSLAAFIQFLGGCSPKVAREDAQRLWWGIYAICRTIEWDRIRRHHTTGAQEIKFFMNIPGSMGRCGIWMSRPFFVNLLQTNAHFTRTDAETLYDSTFDILRIDDAGRMRQNIVTYERELKFYLPLQ